MFTFLSNSLEYIVPFLIVLTVLVFIHELGHYLVARWNGVKIEVFSIGFGPELFGWTDKAQTRWKFSLIPLGGYVRMYGDADASGQSVNPELKTMSQDQKSLTLSSKTPLQRIAVSVAGPLANYFLAAVLLTGLFMVKGMPVPTNDIGMIIEGGVANHMGIKVGDRITRINETPISEFDDVVSAVRGLAGKDIAVTVSRPLSLPTDPATEIPQDTPRETLILSGKMVTTPKEGSAAEEIPASMLGVKPGKVEIKMMGPLQSVRESLYKCYDDSVRMLSLLGKMVTGQQDSSGLGGILSIGDMAQKSATGGLANLILFMAALSINLGLVNLLPVPVLDGGHILFCTIEAIIGRPVSEKVQEWAFGVGLILVVGLMLLTTWNDLSRFKVFEWGMGLFH